MKMSFPRKCPHLSCPSHWRCFGLSPTTPLPHCKFQFRFIHLRFFNHLPVVVMVIWWNCTNYEDIYLTEVTQCVIWFKILLFTCDFRGNMWWVALMPAHPLRYGFISYQACSILHMVTTAGMALYNLFL